MMMMMKTVRKTLAPDGDSSRFYQSPGDEEEEVKLEDEGSHCSELEELHK